MVALRLLPLYSGLGESVKGTPCALAKVLMVSEPVVFIWVYVCTSEMSGDDCTGETGGRQCHMSLID